MDEETGRKLERLREILRSLGSCLVAYSGGVDSTFLLKVASETLGKDKVVAVSATSEIFPQEEILYARKLARELGVPHMVVNIQQLNIPEFKMNPPDRCYYCKKALFQKFKEIAQEKGLNFVIDGSNYDDISDFRPGSRALQELGIRSPLKEAMLTKKDIRVISREMALPTWDKPALACLATRIPYREEITREKLIMVDQAEAYLRDLGFSQVRVRHHGEIARIEVEKQDIPKISNDEVRERIVARFKKLGFLYITLDLQGYRPGSMNEPLKEKVDGH